MPGCKIGRKAAPALGLRCHTLGFRPDRALAGGGSRLGNAIHATKSTYNVVNIFSFSSLLLL